MSHPIIDVDKILRPGRTDTDEGVQKAIADRHIVHNASLTDVMEIAFGFVAALRPNIDSYRDVAEMAAGLVKLGCGDTAIIAVGAARVVSHFVGAQTSSRDLLNVVDELHDAGPCLIVRAWYTVQLHQSFRECVDVSTPHGVIETLSTLLHLRQRVDKNTQSEPSEDQTSAAKDNGASRFTAADYGVWAPRR